MRMTSRSSIKCSKPSWSSVRAEARVRRCWQSRPACLGNHRVRRLRSPSRWASKGGRWQAARTDQEGAALGGRGLPHLFQSLSQSAGAIREVKAQLRRTQLHRRRNSIAFRKVKLTVEIICQKGLSVANPDAGLLKAMWRNSRLGSQSPPDAQLCVRRCRRRRKRRLVPR